MEHGNRPEKAPRKLKTAIWILAVVLMSASVIYQRLTGPTNPKRVSVDINGREYSCRLVRSGTTDTEAVVGIPEPGAPFEAFLHWRRYPTMDEYSIVKMSSDDGRCSAHLPIQPAAGKLEYFITLESPGRQLRIPSGEEDTVILRYKNPVPAGVLIPHIVLMFFAVLFGIRTGLAALFQPSGMRWSAWTTLIVMTIGGLVLGPIVQKYAFGAYWTGWPFGGDLTDNKVAIMWLVWLIACIVIGFEKMKREWLGRVFVLAASIVMVVVYLIPHSMRGSELDYRAVDSGVEAGKAIGTSAE